MTRASLIGDRPVPHSLSALLTPTQAPHARLLKHWEGRIVSLLALVRHPHVHHTLACSLAGSHASSLACSFPHALQLSLFLSCAYTLASSLTRLHPLLARFSRASSLTYFSLLYGPPILFISVARLSGHRVPPSSPRPTCAPLP